MMMNHVPLVAGLFVGFGIAMPIGPVGLLCIQRTLVAGMRVGVSTGLGAATVNVFYGALILLGLSTQPPWLAGAQRILGLSGGLFLLWAAARTLKRSRALGVQSEPASPSALRAYGSAVLFNMTNPMAMILILALLSPIVGRSALSLGDAAMILVGMFSAASLWWVCLSGGVALLRRRLNPTALVYVNQAAALLLTIYGALALARSAQM